MSDLAVESYKKSVAAAFERFDKKVKPVAEELAKVGKELKELKQKKAPTDDEKKKIAALEATIEKLEKKVDVYKLELRTELMLLTPPQKGKADEKEIAKLPAWLKDIVKNKGVTIGGVTVSPDVEFDFKAFKLKKLVVNFEYKF